MFWIHKFSLKLMYSKHDIPPPLSDLYTYCEVDKFSNLLTEEEVCYILDTRCLAMSSRYHVVSMWLNMVVNLCKLDVVKIFKYITQI